MAKLAITPKGVGEKVGFRTIQDDWPLGPGETFTVPEGTAVENMVLAADGLSLEAKTGLTPAEKLAAWQKILDEKTGALSSRLDTLALMVIVGLQGDRERGGGAPLEPGKQAILDAGNADPRRQPAEDLFLAAQEILADLDNVTDVESDPRWPPTYTPA